MNQAASRTGSNRQGFSVTFCHPLRRDTRGKPGLKVRWNLGTADDDQADALVAQLNELLSDGSWWDAGMRAEAARRFDPVIVAAFFGDIESGRIDTRQLREGCIPMPSREDGYSRVYLVGTTGAGKTTLLRHFIGSDPKRDRFPSTSTARTTTADIEIITGEGPYEAALTFMPEHEVRAHVEECLEEACLQAIKGKDAAKIADAFLTHTEQRFRLSNLLGSWGGGRSSPGDPFAAEEEQDGDTAAASAGEAVTPEESSRNRKHLEEYVSRVKTVAGLVGDSIAEDLGTLQEQKTPDDRATWLDLFAEALFDREEFIQLRMDIMDDLLARFDLIEAGQFRRDYSSWPSLWTLSEESREAFLGHMRWFFGNHHRLFGRLLTPLVDGMRVRGPFYPARKDLCVAERLVLLDGQGLGHTAKSATSISTQVTRLFPEVDLILLVDSAQQPMQAAPMELLRTVGSSGHAGKLAVAFTHFDLVKGDNLGTVDQKQEHVLGSTRNALDSLRAPLGSAVVDMLQRRLEEHSFFLGNLDRPTDVLHDWYLDRLRPLLELMQSAAAPVEPARLGPVYTLEGLEIALRDAVEGFRSLWAGRLGFRYQDGVSPEHWSRIKALSRRLANSWANEYDTLRPVADLVAWLQESISRWLDNPAAWTPGEPESQAEQAAALDPVRQGVNKALHNLAQLRISDEHRQDWRTAYSFHGRGSSGLRHEEIERIYEEAAPMLSSAMSRPARDFLHALHQIVREAVEEAGGRFETRG